MRAKPHVRAANIDRRAKVSILIWSLCKWNNWTLVVFGACCSTFIGIAAFNASFIDLIVSAALGAFLVAVQVFIAARSDILSSVFEIIITTVRSPTDVICSTVD